MGGNDGEVAVDVAVKYAFALITAFNAALLLPLVTLDFVALFFQVIMVELQVLPR